MKLSIVGASDWVNRLFEACGNYQWAREFVQNALEAKASRVEFGIEWQAVEKLGYYRRIIVDNGEGMSRDELKQYFSALGEGAKPIRGVHDNFGIGAKIAALPWNPEGVIVISYKAGQASMIWIVANPDTREYELKDFDSGEATSCVIDPTLVVWPTIDWGSLRPEWLKDHGTIIVLLGSREFPDTVLGNPGAGEKDIKGLSLYLNTRFWDFSDIEVRVVELRSDKKNSWPTSAADRDDSRRPNNRTIRGAKYYLTEVGATNGRLSSSDILLIDGDRVAAEWYLWQGERPAVHTYAKEQGYIALRYKGELFQVSSSKVNFRWFGIIESSVQRNLTIILEPQHYAPDAGGWGIHPDQSRNRLIFSGNGEKGVDVPMSDWGHEFADKVPEPIFEAIRSARGEQTATLEDEQYRKRLQEKFGDRWKVKQIVKSRRSSASSLTGEVTEEDLEVVPAPREPAPLHPPRPPGPIGPRPRVRNRNILKVVLKKAIPGGAEAVTEVESPVDVPQIRFEGKDAFERPWHIALWAPTTPGGPTVVINIEAPVVEESVAYHQEQYPELYAEEIAQIVRQVFGEVAACKIAHSQKLAKEISMEELDADYRSEAALTIALMGLMAEESIIATRLGKFGRKRSAVVGQS